MTLNDCSTADDAITAALVQGLHAFMASEALVNANDNYLEAAARSASATPTVTRTREGRCL